MKTFKSYRKNQIFKHLLLSALIGTLIGTLIFAYKQGAELLQHFSDFIYSAIRNNLAYLPLLLLCVTFLCYLAYMIIKNEPFARGGGIPASEGLVRNKVDFKPFKVAIKTFCASYISFFTGVPLGCEGPSVLLGSCVGNGASGFINDKDDNSLTKAGAACAFCAVTGAPLASLCFIEEEMHDGITLKKSCCTLIAILFACLSCCLLCLAFGKEFAMLGYAFVSPAPINYYYLSLICGVIAGTSAFLFVKIFTGINTISLSTIKLPLFVKLLVCFLVCSLLGLFFSNARGSGLSLLKTLTTKHLGLTVLCTVLVVKIICLLTVGASGATGGLFIPMLAVGSLLGAIFGECVINLGVSQEVYSAIVGATTVAFLAGTQYSPLTAILFSIEAMGGLYNAPFTIIAVFISFLVVKLLKGRQIYDKLYDDLEKYTLSK